MKNYLLLVLNIFVISIVVFMILPNFNLKLINNNITKDIDANVYLYTEIEIENDWGVK
jgi:uncharacterized membrane protein